MLLRLSATVLAIPFVLCGLAMAQETPPGNSTPEGQTAQANSTPAFPDLTIPKDANKDQLEAILKAAKSAQPRSPQQYQAMQMAIRDGSKALMAAMKGSEDSARFKQAELDTISSSVSLMTFFGEDAKKKTLEQVHTYLRDRETLAMSDVQTGMMAAAMLELQPNKKPAKDTYQLLDDLLKEDEREEMQSLRLNLQACIRRLDLLGNKFDFAAKTLNGREIGIDDYAGKFVIVDFFATWCEPCLSEIPRLKKHYEKYQSKGLEVIGISLDDNKKDLQKFLERAELNWPIVHDSEEDPLKTIQMQFGISQLPTVLLLNKEGTVVSLEARGSELDRLVEMLFEAPTPAPAAAEAGAKPNAEADAKP